MRRLRNAPRRIRRLASSAWHRARYGVRPEVEEHGEDPDLAAAREYVTAREYALAASLLPRRLPTAEGAQKWIELGKTLTYRARRAGDVATSESVATWLAGTIRTREELAGILAHAFGLERVAPSSIRTEPITSGLGHAYCFCHEVDVGGRTCRLIEKAVRDSDHNEARFADLVLRGEIDISDSPVPRYFHAARAPGLVALFMEYVPDDGAEGGPYSLEFACAVARELGRFGARNPVADPSSVPLQIYSKMRRFRAPSESDLRPTFPRLPDDQMQSLVDGLERIAASESAIMEYVARLPHVIGHNDVNRGNVLVREGRPWFIDWGWAAPVALGADLYTLISICPEAASEEKARGALVDAYIEGFRAVDDSLQLERRDIEIAMWWAFCRRYVRMLSPKKLNRFRLVVQKGVEIAARVQGSEVDAATDLHLANAEKGVKRPAKEKRSSDSLEALLERLADLDDPESGDLFARGFLLVTDERTLRFVPGHFRREDTGLGTLYRDPRLRLARGEAGAAEVLLLGIAADARSGEADQDVLAKGLAKALKRNREAFFEELDWLGGRYVVVARKRPSAPVRLMADATGMRAVFHAPGEPGVAGSHAALVAANVADDGAELGRRLPNKFGFPGLATPWRDVDFLSANTWLEVASGKVKRFYPREAFEERSVEDAGRELVRLARNMARGFHGIAPVVFSLTAGLDSRLSLAIQRDLVGEARTFTYFRKMSQDTDAADLAISGDIAERFGLRWEVLRPREFEADTRLGRIIALNAPYSHVPKLAQIYRRHWGTDEVLHLRSNVSEIGRLFYWRGREQPNSKDPDDLMRPFFKVLSRHRLPGEKAVERARREFQRQFRRTGITKALDTIHYLDLMYWEHRMVSWHSQVVAESDVAFESVSLYNCRKVLEILLSQPFAVRREAGVYHAAIREAWPELLDWPINPEALTPEQEQRALERLGEEAEVVTDVSVASGEDR